MNNLYKYFITVCALLVTYTTEAQQPHVETITPTVPTHININIEQKIKSAERSVKAAALKINSLKLEDMLFAAFDKEKLKNTELNAQKEALGANALKHKDSNKIKTADNALTKSSASISEKQKHITKTYRVTSKDKLSINNQYGRVTVQTWNKPEFKIDILIKAQESTDSRAQELLDAVVIEEANRENLFSYKTTIAKKTNSWWGAIKRSTEPDVKRGIEVFYTVYMPSGNPLDIINAYGSVILPNFEGPVSLNCSYSSLSAQRLKNPANKLAVSYGSASIEALSGSLRVSYGSLNLMNADRLNANIKYSSAKINKISDGGNLVLEYTPSFRVSEVGNSVKKLVINASYSGIVLGFDKSADYNFDVTVSYGGFNYNNNKVTITNILPDSKQMGFNPTKNYKGIYGSGNKGSKIVIKSDYGGVKFL